MRFFISDTHFGHANIIRYCDRPFSTAEDMDKAMIDRWNELVTDCDEVFFIGDFSLTLSAERTAEILHELRGTKHLILGNHDDRRSKGFWSKHFATVEDTRRVLIAPVNRSVTLHHYPMRGSEAPRLLIHGHSHHTRPLLSTCESTRQLRINVSVEGLDYTPISEDRISEFIEQHEVSFLEKGAS